MSVKYIIATIKDWNIDNYRRYFGCNASWGLITSPSDYDRIRQNKPKYVFFPHWSWLVPRDIYGNYECVIFHMTDLPFGRGAEPLQHLIGLGYKNTMISAIKCVEDVDAGEIYMQRSLLLDGSASEIYKRCSDIVYQMIIEIAMEGLKPVVSQTGKPFYFNKRSIEDWRLPDVDDVNKVYDWIRMQDAESYPLCFLETHNLRLEFSQAKMVDNSVEAKVKISPRGLAC